MLRISILSITLKQINKLAIPALISGVSEPILSLTDAAIIGNMEHNATTSLAAVGIVTTWDKLEVLFHL